MSITDRVYRVCTYVAGDWTGDSDAIEIIKKWNEGDKWKLRFRDVHTLTQSSDNSLNCSIKSSLRIRMEISKTFVLVVGDMTNSLRSGSCHLCENYIPEGNFGPMCIKGHNSIDLRSYVQYECEMAYKDFLDGVMRIVVLYNDVIVDKNKCPEVLKNVGTHVPMKKIDLDITHGIQFKWDYESVKKALDK